MNTPAALQNVIAKTDCADVVQRWAFYRDQKRWQDLQDIFTSDGEIHVCWYKGSATGFVEHLRSRDQARAGMAKHHIFPSVVDVSGTRALAETSAVIMVRQMIGDILVDLNSKGRFLDRLEKHNGKWLIRERIAVYEQDRMDPVEPSEAFDRLLQEADTSIYPVAYRYMGFRVAAAGGQLVEPVITDDCRELLAIKTRFASWLHSSE